MTHLALQAAESLKSLGVHTAYGEPIELDGVTVIPVACVQFGFGGGSDGSGDEAAGGAGGGGYSMPLGAYVRDREGLRFQPNLIALLAVGIPFVWVAGKALSRIVRALKK